MPLGLRFELEDGPVAHAEMHETTHLLAARFWGASLSGDDVATHAMYAGPEIMMDLAEEARTFWPTESGTEPAGGPEHRGRHLVLPGAQPHGRAHPRVVGDRPVLRKRWPHLRALGWTPCNIIASVRTAWPRLPRRVQEFT